MNTASQQRKNLDMTGKTARKRYGSLSVITISPAYSCYVTCSKWSILLPTIMRRYPYSGSYGLFMAVDWRSSTSFELHISALVHHTTWLFWRMAVIFVIVAWAPILVSHVVTISKSSQKFREWSSILAWSVQGMSCEVFPGAHHLFSEQMVSRPKSWFDWCTSSWIRT